mmetsp:Transcript_55169/g.102144  ORF Transcript_55169/g.102144 Transcript_55169/m.102144 type:complete len:539 (+) Transcript_55169:435-2051(+)
MGAGAGAAPQPPGPPPPHGADPPKTNIDPPAAPPPPLGAELPPPKSKIELLLGAEGAPNSVVGVAAGAAPAPPNIELPPLGAEGVAPNNAAGVAVVPPPPLGAEPARSKMEPPLLGAEDVPPNNVVGAPKIELPLLGAADVEPNSVVGVVDVPPPPLAAEPAKSKIELPLVGAEAGAPNNDVGVAAGAAAVPPKIELPLAGVEGVAPNSGAGDAVAPPPLGAEPAKSKIELPLVGAAEGADDPNKFATDDAAPPELAVASVGAPKTNALPPLDSAFPPPPPNKFGTVLPVLPPLGAELAKPKIELPLVGAAEGADDPELFPKTNAVPPLDSALPPPNKDATLPVLPPLGTEPAKSKIELPPVGAEEEADPNSAAMDVGAPPVLAAASDVVAPKRKPLPLVALDSALPPPNKDGTLAGAPNMFGTLAPLEAGSLVLPELDPNKLATTLSGLASVLWLLRSPKSLGMLSGAAAVESLVEPPPNKDVTAGPLVAASLVLPPNRKPLPVAADGAEPKSAGSPVAPLGALLPPPAAAGFSSAS